MGTVCALHCVHHQLIHMCIMLVYLIHAYIKSIIIASWCLHHWSSIMAIASCQIHLFIRMGKFHHCIALALQSYISRVHHSHGHRAYASRIIPFNLINSLSKNVLEQKLTLISFLSRITTRLRNWFFQDLDPLFSAKSCYMLVLE